MGVSDYIAREVFVERMKDDIKRILDSTTIIIYREEDYGKSMWTRLKEISGYTEAEYTDWESMWTRLKEISKMTGAEYIADVKKARQVKVAQLWQLWKNRVQTRRPALKTKAAQKRTR